jgi:acyl-CoA synthetase (AMP-forming)/AMP-acid ligase II
MKLQNATFSLATETSSGSVISDLCDRIESGPTAIPIIRARETLDARALVAAARARAAIAPELAGTVVPILADQPQDMLGALFTVGLAGGVPLLLNGARPYESAASVQSRVSDVSQTVNAKFVYMHGIWHQVSKQSVPEHAYPYTAFLQFSSGSVGSPRPLRISDRAIRAQLDMINSALAVGRDAIAGSWLPLSHDMGLVSSLLALWLGRPVLLWDPAEFLLAPALWVEQMAAHRVSFWPVIPAGLHVATKALAARGHDLSALQAVLVGADVIRPDVLTAFESVAGCRPGVVRPCYGLADATLMVTCSPADRHWRTVGVPGGGEKDGRPTEMMSVGVPVRNTEVWIEVDGKPVGEFVIGDVVVRSASRCSGPFGGEVVAPSTPVRTGDIGFMSDGELVFTGRKAEVIRVAGEDFLPTEVEHFLVRRGFAKGGRVAVVGVAQEAMTRMVAVIESDSAVSDHVAAAACRRDVLRSARDSALPLTEVRFVPKNWLSKTTSGKLRRRRIATELMEASK